MDNFKAVYKILSALEKAMDCEAFEISQIDYKALDVSKERWANYIEMLYDEGYIKGIRAFKDITGSLCIRDEGIKITFKGLEYLHDNTNMKKLYNLTKGIVDIIPHI